MLGNFFPRSTDHKQRLNMKQKVKIDSAASSRGQGKYTKYISFLRRPLEASLTVFKFSLFC
jgi:hypothetical protein